MIVRNVVRHALGASVIAAVLVACSDPKPPPAVPVQPAIIHEQPALPAAPPAPVSEPTNDEIVISDEILKACGISQARAKFAFDSSRIEQGDHPVLDELALCFTSGKLSGRSMNLVGHADPRGEAEYNLVLGGKRADNVKHYLTKRGLGEQQAETTSRGELDANGVDDTTWSNDRRVQVLLAE
jgi:peptidoglycan-associated lipoprotein